LHRLSGKFNRRRSSSYFNLSAWPEDNPVLKQIWLIFLQLKVVGFLLREELFKML